MPSQVGWHTAGVDRLRIEPSTLIIFVSGTVGSRIFAHAPEDLPVDPQFALLQLAITIVVLQHWLHFFPLPATHDEVEGAQAHGGSVEIVGGEGELSPRF